MSVSDLCEEGIGWQWVKPLRLPLIFPGEGSLNESPRSELVKVKCTYPINSHNVLETRPRYPQRLDVTQKSLCMGKLYGRGYRGLRSFFDGERQNVLALISHRMQRQVAEDSDSGKRGGAVQPHPPLSVTRAETCRFRTGGSVSWAY